MKKFFLVLMTVVLLFGFMSCATKTEAQKAQDQIPPVIGADGILRPDWVFQGKDTAEKHFSVGFSDPLVLKSVTMKKAEASARIKMAEWISTTVTEVVAIYVNDSSDEENRKAFDSYKSLSLQVSQATLSGSSREDFWTDPEGGVYVLASIPKANIEQAFAEKVEKANASFQDAEAAEEANNTLQELLQRVLYEDN